MCPEGSKIKINKKIISAIIITAIVLLTVFVIVRYAVLRPVPELQRLKGLEVNRYDVACYAYDGDKYSYVIKKFKSADEYKRELLKITGLMDTRLVKVNDWTPDKITYPVYALEITPVIFKSEKYEHGETFVWSNGYLLTSSGDVYRSGLFFKRYLNNDEDDYFRETDTITNIADIRPFRPLFMANKEWNKDMLRVSILDDSEFAENIEAAVTGFDGEEDALIATVRIINNGEYAWNYSDQSLFARLEVNIDGQWYSIFHDPSVDDDIRTMLGYNQRLDAGQETDVVFHLGFFGKLPPGRYRIVIWGQYKSRQANASAEFLKS